MRHIHCSWKNIALALISVVLATSCNNIRRTKKGKPLVQRSPGTLIKKNEKSNFNYDYVHMKMNVDVSDETGEESFKANVKMKKDSIIWMSITPTLGIEAIRLVVTKDSLKLYSKIPNNKFYYEGTFEDMVSKTGVSLEFEMIQEVLVGNAIMLDKQEDKLLSNIDDQHYYLVNKFHRRLKKILELDERQLGFHEDPDIKVSFAKYDRNKDRSQPEELMIKRFWMDPFDYKVTKAMYNDFYNLRDITIGYEAFEEEKDQIYPTIGRLRIVEIDEKWQEFSFKITRLKSGKVLEFNYKVPEGYERKDHL